MECVGAPGMVQAAIAAAATAGRVVIAGVRTAPDTVVPVSALFKEVEVGFAMYYRSREFAAAVAFPASDEAAFIAAAVLDGGAVAKL